MAPGRLPHHHHRAPQDERGSRARAKFGDPAGLYALSWALASRFSARRGWAAVRSSTPGVVLRPDFARLQRRGWPTEVTTDGSSNRGSRAQRRCWASVRRRSPSASRSTAAEPSCRGWRHEGATTGDDDRAHPRRQLFLAWCNTAVDTAAIAGRCNVGSQDTTGITYIAGRGRTTAQTCSARAPYLDHPRRPTAGRSLSDDLTAPQGETHTASGRHRRSGCRHDGTAELLFGGWSPGTTAFEASWREVLGQRATTS